MAARLALVVGPTPGHVYPALALTDAIRAEDASADVVLVGPSESEASRLIDANRYRLETIPALRLVRATPIERVRAVFRVGAGILAARRLLWRAGTQMVISFGSYASGATILAARSLGLLTAVHEANAVPGLANRLLGRIVDRVYLGVEMPRSRWYDTARAKLVGTPVRSEIAALASVPRQFPADRPLRVLVIGGAWGPAFLAREVPPLLCRLAESGVPLEVWHQVGSEPAEPIARAYREAHVPAQLMSYIDNMAAAYRWADVVVARSGANVTSELAIAGLPALLVPWAEASDDHQAANARVFAGAGAGVWTSEAEWSCDRLADRLRVLMTSGDAWGSASSAARSMARPDAATALARDALALIAGSR